MGDEYQLQIQQESVKCLQYYMKNLLTLLQHLLIWPCNSFSPYKYFCVVGLVTTFLVANFLLIAAEIIAVIVDSNIQRFVNAIGTLGFHATGFVKWSFCIKRNRAIIDLVDQLDKCHRLSSSIDNQEKGKTNYEQIMEETRWNVNMLVNLWPCYVGYAALHWCTNPFIIRIFNGFDWEHSNTSALPESALPYIGWYPWDINYSHNYYYTYLLQVVGAFGTVLGVVSFDVLYVSLLIFTCGQLRYLNISLSYTSDHSSEAWENGLEEKLRKSVAQHIEVTKFLYNMEALLNPITFTQCLETLTVICLLSFEASAIHVTADIKSIIKLWSMLEYFLGTAGQLYCICFFATEIKYLGLQVAQSAYSCGWEIVSSQKNFKSISSRYMNVKHVECLVNMMMVRAQKPILLTGGPFYELSLETFKAIMGMAVSNSVILRQAAEMD